VSLFEIMVSFAALSFLFGIVWGVNEILKELKAFRVEFRLHFDDALIKKILKKITHTRFGHHI
jgi:hypothetical protein